MSPCPANRTNFAPRRRFLKKWNASAVVAFLALSSMSAQEIPYGPLVSWMNETAQRQLQQRAEQDRDKREAGRAACKTSGPGAIDQDRIAEDDDPAPGAEEGGSAASGVAEGVAKSAACGAQGQETGAGEPSDRIGLVA